MVQLLIVSGRGKRELVKSRDSSPKRIRKENPNSGNLHKKPLNLPEKRRKASETIEHEMPEEKDDNKSSVAAIEQMFPAEKRNGCRELDGVTSKMLEYELRHIMIKVWQEFPDNPSTEEEHFVAEKFRNEAGDELINVIGLNVTKRLLNIYNRLLVKVQFSNRPEKGRLLMFLKKYNIRGFKRIATESNTFAAQLKSIEDFDRICKDKQIKCGGAKLTITPCYRFMKCPDGLKTKFVDQDEDSTKDSEKEVTIEKAAKTTGNGDIDKTDIPVKIKIEKVEPELNTVITPVVAKISEAKSIKTEKTQSKVTSTTVQESSKIRPTITTDNKIAQSLANKHVDVQNVTEEPKRFLNNQGKNVEAKKVVENAKNVTNNEYKKTLEKTQVKTNLQKESSIKMIKYDNKQIQKPMKAPVVICNKKVVTTQKTAPKETKKIKKPLNATKIKVQNVTAKKNIKNNDFEEMADEEILALLSNVVVLDECGGEDE